MRGSEVLLQMLKEYEVKAVFGLPGETTLPLYISWLDFIHDIKHVMLRDERNACFAADGFARGSYRPGVCEAPSSGAAHVVPPVIEAQASALPMIVITTDVPLNLERKGMLTGFNQTAIFSGIVKESLTILRAQDIPFTIRRAFRAATSGRPGPVHIRIPLNVLEEDSEVHDLYAQKEFSKYPSHRFAADEAKIIEAVDLLLSSEKPLIVCGQGALYSQAWDEIVELAEMLMIPVGSTITGKGCFPETHPLSIGVVGSRGGTSFSNSILSEADLVFYIGSNTDYTATDNWTLPASGTKIIHLNISEFDVGNSVKANVILIGDAKATLKKMIEILKVRLRRGTVSYRYRDLENRRKVLEEVITKEMNSNDYPINPVRFIKTLEKILPRNYILACDPGVSAIYTAAFFRIKEAGRKIMFNYSIGSLGYAVPAAIGALYADPSATVFALTGDGSFSFVVGELEAISRLDLNIKILLFNNNSYGWMRATALFTYGPRFFETDFKPIDYLKIAEGFGIEAYRIEGPDNIEPKLRKAINIKGPVLIDVPVSPEDIFVPPVPSWARKAKELNIKYIY